MDKSQSSSSPTPPASSIPEKITLWGEIKKGWDWVVFSWQLLQRMGGFGQIIKSIYTVIKLLIHRTLVQWGIFPAKK